MVVDRILWRVSASIMTFVWHVDCDADGTFVRVAVIRHPLAADRNSNCVVAMVALVHNLDSATPVDPYQCRSTHVQAITAIVNDRTKIRRKSSLRLYLYLCNKMYLAVVCRSTRSLSIAVTVIGIRFHLRQSVAIINARMGY